MRRVRPDEALLVCDIVARFRWRESEGIHDASPRSAARVVEVFRLTTNNDLPITNHC
jgi:hypothetical protein